MVFLLVSGRMAPPLPLIFMLLMISGVSSDDWGVSYSPSHICALNDSTVIMRCTYTYPTGYQIKKVFWTKGPILRGVELPDLSNDPEYSQRLQYLGDKQQNCTVRLSHVTLKDSHMYYFRFITDKPDGKWNGVPGVTLTVTDLQVESPERVTEGDSVSLTCKSSCALTDRATFIWYRNSQKILTEIKFSNKLSLNPVRREDSGRYSCAVDGHTHVSPAVELNVMYPPRSASVSISPSGVIVEGDSVTLNCISDSNPPAEIHWFKGRTIVGSGRIFNISKISSDDSGEYKCKSINEHGEKYSDAVTLNVMYPPRSVSVLINGSGEIVEGDSVTLKCISDSNPPALNFSWFKENETSAVGSGQSFSALQSGRFYCQAHNQHGSQRSDAVTVTAHGFFSGMPYIVIGIAAGCAVLFLVCIIMFKRKRKCGGVSNVKQNQVRTDQTAGRTESTDSGKIKYATIQHIGNNEAKYENLRTLHHDPAVRCGAVKDNLVIYSSIK
ncbi:B-cell receptor CD22-like [Rhinichthys klamathensis goyatoka]|uniref:B-cell receptor CD22-like n=1 Tax=Rhinichthys klamathensis goyatoka TaxID=3034132 RepID=UPI0024B61186|nr:B-cell receptor CD22-like [Rhinichthys klamathensis goyatoka]